jgi:hypothetical protein
VVTLRIVPTDPPKPYCEPCVNAAAGLPTYGLQDYHVQARLEGKVHCETCKHLTVRTALEERYSAVRLRRWAFRDAMLDLVLKHIESTEARGDG